MNKDITILEQILEELKQIKGLLKEKYGTLLPPLYPSNLVCLCGSTAGCPIHPTSYEGRGL